MQQGEPPTAKQLQSLVLHSFSEQLESLQRGAPIVSSHTCPAEYANNLTWALTQEAIRACPRPGFRIKRIEPKNLLWTSAAADDDGAVAV